MLDLPNPALIGVIHLPPLPGSPRHIFTMDEIVDRAVTDARTLVGAAFDAWLRSGKLSTELPDSPLLSRSGLEAVRNDFVRGRVHFSRLWSLLVLREFMN